MSKFKRGDEVVCIDDDWSVHPGCRQLGPTPKKDDIYVVSEIRSILGIDCITFHGYRNYYSTDAFEKVIPKSQIDQLLEETVLENAT